MKLIYMLVAAMAAATGSVVFGQNGISATAEPVPVDLRTGVVCGAIGVADISYSPRWADANASIRIESVSGSSTNVIKTGAVGEEGRFLWAQPDAAIATYRLLMWTVRDGVAVGEPLSAHVSFGIQSAAGAAVTADTRTNSLQLALSAAAPVSLSYSTAWEDSAVSLAIDAVRLSGKGGTATGTNTIFSAVADAEGKTVMCGLAPGWWRLACRLVDSSGGTLAEYLTDEFKRKGGFSLSVR